MSADNWVVCPECLKKARAKKTELDKAVKNAYGKVSREEHRRLTLVADDFVVPNCRTFREDYEIGIWEGKFFIGYFGKCRECGLEKSFKHEEQFPL